MYKRFVIKKMILKQLTWFKDQDKIVFFALVLVHVDYIVLSCDSEKL